MKKILLLMMLLPLLSMGQKLGAKVVEFDSITSIVRNGYSVPYGKSWIIYNGTTGQFEYSNGSNTWSRLGASWGTIPGTLSAQTDLQAALDLKADTSAIPTVLNTLTSTSTTSALSAAQGKVLQDGKLNLSGGTMSGNIDFNYLYGIENIDYIDITMNGVDSKYLRFILNDGATDQFFLAPSNGAGFQSILMYDYSDDEWQINDVKIATVDDLAGAGTDDQTAAEVTFTPNGSIAATNVQAAIQEVRDEAGAGSGDALTTSPLSQFAATTSAQLSGVISDETGTGFSVFATSPTLTTPNLGTPSAVVLTNATGLTSTGIVDGTILNADINAAAGIASTKIALTPFGDIASTNVQDGFEELYTEQGTQISTNTGNISTNATDIAAIELSLSTVPASSIAYNNQTAPYTLVAADAQDNKIVRLAYNGEDLTLPSGVFDEGQSIKITYAQTGTGDANIVEGSGTSILGYTDGITLSAYPSGVTLSRISSATAPEVYEVVDYYGTIADYIASSLGPEEVTNGSFDTDTDWTKQNGTTISGGVANVIGAGDISSTGSNHVLEQPITLTNTNLYTVEIRLRYVTGTGNIQFGQDFYIWETFTASGTMTTYTFTANAANANTNFTIGAASGTTVEIEYVSVKEEL